MNLKPHPALALTLILLSACREEKVVAPPKATATTTTTQIQKVPEGAKQEFEIGFVRPNYLTSFTVGRAADKGAVEHEKFKAGEIVRAVGALNLAPAGLAAKLVVLDEKEKVANEESRIVPTGSKEVVFDWTTTKKARGKYRLQLFLGADKYDEKTITIE